MLRLKRVSLIGFKTFCDHTEFTLPGSGIAVVAGPNGCGKSNILDGMSWVLGEQSAKSLRGAQMQDVIFAGTRDRTPLNMAEVTLTLVDPEIYEEPLIAELNQSTDLGNSWDWDEDEMRRKRAADAEAIAAAASPEHEEEGDVVRDEASPKHSYRTIKKDRGNVPQFTVRQGETVISRRLFRTGESEYRLNGKQCRLRDLQEIFLSTGLGPDTYAIIGQEQIGQLLSSKPHDRRAVIEEAAGIGELKAHRRLVEVRLNGANDSLARVEDILDEVSRQVVVLKRQAAKAERVGVVRDDLHRHEKILMASRVALIDTELRQLESGHMVLTSQVEVASARIEATEGQLHTLAQEGYELERAVQEAQNAANAAEVELERATAEQGDNDEHLRELEQRLLDAVTELEQARTELSEVVQEREQQEALAVSVNEEFRVSENALAARQRDARGARQAVFAKEQQLEAQRRHGAQLMTRAGEIRNRASRAQESLAMLEQEADRLAVEIREGRETLKGLDHERTKTGKGFEAASQTLAGIESEIKILDETLQARRTDEHDLHRLANALRTEQASAFGRRGALDAVLRDHGYATETVQKLLRIGTALKAADTLASYLEVGEEHERIVDDFLRDELNYVVVGSWIAAEEGIQLLKSSVDGRATFLVHPLEAGHASGAEEHLLLARPGLTPLRDQIRVSNGLEASLETTLPKLRNGYIVDNAREARHLAAEFPAAFFLTPQGECFHNLTVTGGTPAREGPLSMRRERQIIEVRLAAIDRELTQAEADGARLATTIGQLSDGLRGLSLARQHVETDLANLAAALKQMGSSITRLEHELQDRESQEKRNEEAREIKRISAAEASKEAEQLEVEYSEAEDALERQAFELVALRGAHDALEQDVVAASAEFAMLAERRRTMGASLLNSENTYNSLERRLSAIEDRRAIAEAERQERLIKTTTFTDQIRSLAAQLAESRAQRERAAAALDLLRQRLMLLESELKAERVVLDHLREDRDRYSQSVARLRADLEHYAATSSADLGVEVETLRADESIPRLSTHELNATEEFCRQMRARIEQMGPVNMMALDEYNESAARYEFLQTQRKDLQAVIECAQAEIREIDEVVQARFGEALARINENFEKVFAWLFSGGHAQLRVTQPENQREGGLEIAASPPGKKLQNALLLSGGEKALTALALVVAIFQYRPSPFCGLDEVDAPLDETNIGRFADFMRHLSGDTQFLVVTHSRTMMQAADMIFGVTMQEPGISKVLSLRLDRA